MVGGQERGIDGPGRDSRDVRRREVRVAAGQAAQEAHLIGCPSAPSAHDQPEVLRLRRGAGSVGLLQGSQGWKGVHGRRREERGLEPGDPFSR